MAKKDKKTGRRSIVTYTKRGPRNISDKRKTLIKELLPSIEITDKKKIKDPYSLFAKGTREIWLEIGFGGGEHLAEQARKHPNIGFIGCEVFAKGVSSLLRHVDEYKLKNIRIFQDDALVLLENLPNDCLDRIFILFPDPWPKTKHHKRRMINHQNLNLIARKLKAGGLLRIATDHMEYLRWMMIKMLEREDYTWLARRPVDWNSPSKDHFTTRYEEKLKTGKPPIFLNYFLKN